MAIAATLVVVTVGVYHPLLGSGFLNYDDNAYVTENPAVLDGLCLGTLRWAFTAFHSANWHPLTWLSHALDVQIFGLWPGGHHLTNLVLHVLNVLLLWVFLWRATRIRFPSALVAALFAWHPLHVESVAWIAERKDMLSACFALLALLAYDAYAKRPSVLRMGMVSFLFACGLMAKPMLVTLPCLLLLLDYWPYGRIGLDGSARDILRRAARLIGEKAPLFALTAASCGVTVLAQRHAMASLDRVSAGGRLANALSAYVAYLGKAFVPHGLATPYPLHPDSLSGWQVFGAAAVMLMLTAGVLVAQRRGAGYLLVGWLWFVGMLVPVIGIVQVGNQAYADRYMYLPLIGIYVMLAWAMASWVKRWPVVRVPLGVVIGLALAGLLALTAMQVRYWHDSGTLFRRTLAVTERNSVAHNNLGQHLMEQGQVQEALEHFQRAFDITPGNAAALNNLGAAYLALGQYEAAASCFATLIEALPEAPALRVNFAAALAGLGQHGVAQHQLDLALQLDPNFEKAKELRKRLNPPAS